MHWKPTHSLAKANSSGDRMEGSPLARDFSFSSTCGKNFSICHWKKKKKKRFKPNFPVVQCLKSSRDFPYKWSSPEQVHVVNTCLPKHCFLLSNNTVRRGLKATQTHVYVTGPRRIMHLGLDKKTCHYNRTSVQYCDCPQQKSMPKVWNPLGCTADSEMGYF